MIRQNYKDIEDATAFLIAAKTANRNLGLCHFGRTPNPPSCSMCCTQSGGGKAKYEVRASLQSK